MENVSQTKMLFINLSSAFLIFVINLLVNFFLSPYIVRHLGVDANGFIQLASTFVTYIGIIALALNSMAARFITVALINSEDRKANEYYSSTFAGNILLILLLLIPVTAGISFLEHFVKISSDLVCDVKILFALIFASYFISIGAPMWNIASFVTNRVYLQSVGNMISTLVKSLTILLLFLLFPSKVWYVGLSAVLASTILQVWQFYYKKKYFNELRINHKKIRKKRIKELLASGVWNSINQMGTILFGGLDLLLANLFIGPEVMGLISLSQIVPNVLGSLQGTIASVFNPEITILYAQNKTKELVANLFRAGKINIVLLSIPFSILVVFGKEFFGLWIPSANSDELQLYSVLYIMSFLVLVGMVPLWNVFGAVNKTRQNAISVVLSGGISISLTIIALKYTSLGAIAICGISTIVSVFRNLIFTVPFAAKYLGIKWTTFYPLIKYTMLNFMADLLIGFLIRSMILVNSWLTLFAAASIFGIISLLVSAFTVLSRQERQFLTKKLRLFHD
ncbi:MAG: oligosaccharide flippase family protein [Streptococcaceae bacterium]|jgi:O-antigen/teichoic acid export membrane protein|nr:oligosaccharide flippase family protein [Streptococcaceae bacterium]